MKRYLVVANQTLESPVLHDRLRSLAETGAQFHLVVPATAPSTDHRALGHSEHLRHPGEQPGYPIARWRLRSALRRLSELELEVTGDVGVPDPYKAVTQALVTHPVDEILVSTLPRRRSKWLSRDKLPQRLRKRLAVPVTHLENGPVRAAPHVPA